MNHTNTDTQASHVKPMKRLLAAHFIFMLIFTAGLVLSFESLFRQIDDFRHVRIGLWAVNLITLMTLTGFIHYYLLRQAFQYRNRPDSTEAKQYRSVLQDIWMELLHYPYRMASYLTSLAFGLMILMNSFYHLLIGSSFGHAFTSMLLVMFFLALWIGPLAVWMYIYSESSVRKISGLIFTPEQWRLIDFSDTHHFYFSGRIKSVAVTLIPLICFLVLLILMLGVYDSFLNPVVSGLFVFIVIYHASVAWVTSRSSAEQVGAMDKLISRINRKQPLTEDDRIQLIRFTRDEVGKLSHSVFDLCDRIIPLLTRYSDGRAELTVQLEDIASICKNQNTVSYSQASALSELAATMEEIVQSVNQIATDAMRTSQMTQQGLEEIEKGKKHLEQTLDSIDQIYQESLASSQRIMDLSLKMVQIEDVVRIINYVTDHTKILAFNAAIETASAGEVGERFGVVAKEIRQLAQNISDSTEEIKKIINDVKKTAHASVITTEKELKQVNASVKSASEAQMVFNEIYSVIKNASDAVSNISAAIGQQRVVHEQVWSSIKDIDASAKELLKKSHTMVEVTERLKSAGTDNIRS